MTDLLVLIAILAVLILIYIRLAGTPSAPRWTGVFTRVRIGGTTITGEIDMLDVKMEIGQTVEITVGNFVDRLGNPSAIDPASAAWEIEEADVFEITPGEATATSATASFRHIGTEEIGAVITFTADGDTDPGEEQPVTVTGKLTIDSPNAVSGEMTAGTPHD